MSAALQDPQLTLNDIRDSLKQWEREFAARNHGKKPSQTDIKNDPDISAKYRQYNKLKRASQPETPSKSNKIRLSKPTALRDRDVNRTNTPRKALKSVKEVEAVIGDVVAEVIEPQEVEDTPAFIRCALGPTPQRDGQILGIFDSLPSASPSKRKTTETVNDTPIKTQTNSHLELPGATPRTSNEKHGTPLKRKRDDDYGTPSTSKRQFATPSFLRRNFLLPSVDETDSEPRPFGFRKRPLVRSLSSMIQGLRKQDEKHLDDELDILNELEAEESGQPLPNKSKVSEPPNILVQDSQVADMPLGPDELPQNSDGEDEVDLRDANGQPRKPWKKKGLKRQTKRVIMRPVKHRPQKASAEAEAETERVLETQIPDGPNLQMIQEDNGSDPDFHDDEQQHKPSAKKKPAKQTKTPAKEDGDIKKAAKKVSASAHANFRKLKIKNKNSKANGRGRFGRR